MQKFERVVGNEQVCQMLEVYLEHAKRGRMSFIALVGCENGGYSADFVGDPKSYFPAYFGLDDVKAKVRAGATLRQNGLTPSGDTPGNMFCYDLTVEPACFDFLVWLCNCEMIRRREGGDKPLRIAFMRRRDEDIVHQGAQDKRDAFLKNVMEPALALFGAINDPTAMQGRQVNEYALKPIVEAVKNGEELPLISVPQPVMAAVAAHLNRNPAMVAWWEKPVTITLRETDAWEHRNSNIEAWTKFARWLQAKGERVIIVRDTSKAEEPLEDFETFPAGSRNLHMRAALYEQAKCNLFTTNGPGILAIFGTRPWLYFVTLDENEPFHCNTPDWWETYQGIGPGEQLPWASPQQRFVFADDTFENLCAAWENHIAS